MANTIGKRVKTVDTAGNSVLANPGDHGKTLAGTWIALHPGTGQAVELRTSEPVVENVDSTITASSPVILRDAAGNTTWKGNIMHSVWISA